MINQCKVCGTEKVLRPAGITKNGTPYESFYSCPNYRDPKHRQAKEEYKKKKEPINGNAILSDEIIGRLDKIEKRFDDMSAWISLNSKKWEK